MRHIRLVSALFALLIAGQVSAANLVVNPHFDQGIDAWTASASDVTIRWEKVDALASPSSGAIALTTTMAAGFKTVTQCVAVTPGVVYEASVRVMLDGQQPSSRGYLLGVFFSSTDCTGPFVTSASLETDRVTEPSHGRFTPVAGRVQTPADAHSIKLAAGVGVSLPGGTVTVHFDDVYFGPSGACLPSQETLCLNASRFRVKATFRTADAASPSPAQAVQLTNDSGYFWFFNADNVEMTVKVLAACVVNNRHWVFASGMTNVEVQLVVTDTTTGAIERYTNKAGNPFEVILDTNAFGCP